VSLTVILSSVAEMELQESYEWYEYKQAGLGERFLGQIEASINAIVLNPELYPIKIRSFRQYVVSKFPYIIVYELISEQRLIHILHIFHTDRNPVRITKNLGNYDS